MSEALDRAQQFLNEAVNLLPPAPSTDTVIVGLMGYAQSGKDTTAQVLIEDYDFARIAFADALRDMAYALNPLIPVPTTEGDFVYERLSALVDLLGWERSKTGFTEVRQLLQRLGTEAGRNVLGQNIWVETAMRKLGPCGRYVFTDVRFPNEVDAIAKAGGALWRVEREGTKPVNAHASETAVDYVPADALILNNGTVDDLHNAVRTLAKEFGWA